MICWQVLLLVRMPLVRVLLVCVFLVHVLFVQSGSHVYAQILGPGDPPRPMPPPAAPLREDLRQKIQRPFSPKPPPVRNSATGQSPTQDPTRPQRRPLVPATKDSTLSSSQRKTDAKRGINPPSAFSMQLTWVIPGWQVQQDREGYTSELGTDLRVAYGLNASDFVLYPEGWWVGLRMLGISGNARFQGQSGRFGFVYFGPYVAYQGFLGNRPQSGSPDESAEKRRSKRAAGSVLQTPLRAEREQLWQLHLGLVGQSRSAELDPSLVAPDNELDTKGFAFDGPGLWVEVGYMLVWQKVMSLNLRIGLQQGEQKTLYWLGMGSGGWI